VLDQCVEGPHVNISLLPTALGCGSTLVMLDRRVEVPISQIRREAESPLFSDVHIHL
jgi:hypothetical protein